MSLGSQVVMVRMVVVATVLLVVVVAVVGMVVVGCDVGNGRMEIIISR